MQRNGTIWVISGSTVTPYLLTDGEYGAGTPVALTLGDTAVDIAVSADGAVLYVLQGTGNTNRVHRFIGGLAGWTVDLNAVITNAGTNSTARSITTNLDGSQFSVLFRYSNDDDANKKGAVCIYDDSLTKQTQINLPDPSPDYADIRLDTTHSMDNDGDMLIGIGTYYIDATAKYDGALFPIVGGTPGSYFDGGSYQLDNSYFGVGVGLSGDSNVRAAFSFYNNTTFSNAGSVLSFFTGSGMSALQQIAVTQASSRTEVEMDEHGRYAAVGIDGNSILIYENPDFQAYSAGGDTCDAAFWVSRVNANSC